MKTLKKIKSAFEIKDYSNLYRSLGVIFQGFDKQINLIVFRRQTGTLLYVFQILIWIELDLINELKLS